MEVEMAKNPTGSGADRPTHPLLEKLGEMRATAEGLFVYSVKIVCGKQTETNCCCVAGVRPGLYATEVNIQNLNIEPAQVTKFVAPLLRVSPTSPTPRRFLYARSRKGWSRDVTSDIANELRRRCAEVGEVPSSLEDFLGVH
jgi:hypothetical protein